MLSIGKFDGENHLIRNYVNTVTYGLNYASYLALYILYAIMAGGCDGVDAVRDTLTHQTYVHDICS